MSNKTVWKAEGVMEECLKYEAERRRGLHPEDEEDDEDEMELG